MSVDLRLAMQGKNVLVCGLARSGVSAAKMLCRLGARVAVHDLKGEDQLEADLSELYTLGCALHLGEDPVPLVEGRDLIVISPGIPYAAPFVARALSLQIPVIGELELGASVTRGKLAAITGTNGKTTTTTLVGEFLRAAGKTTHVVGNIGYPITEVAASTASGDVTVCEVSSYQCESLDAFHPHVAALLNISEDHLARHKTMAVYIASKMRIFARQDAHDVAVFNYDDAQCRACADVVAQVRWFSRKEIVPRGACVQEGWIVLRDEEKLRCVCLRDEVRLPGAHNLENVLAAVVIADALGVSEQAMREVLLRFAGVEHRIETVRELDGVTWINDSKGTNVDSTLRAIDTMDRPTILILGGSDKKVSFAALAERIAKAPQIRLCVLLGETAAQIEQALLYAGVRDFVHAGFDFDRCLAICRDAARPGENVLLSPACASFDMFRDFEDRGRVFKQKVNAML